MIRFGARLATLVPTGRHRTTSKSVCCVTTIADSSGDGCWILQDRTEGWNQTESKLKAMLDSKTDSKTMVERLD